jgi:phosphonatase-like hydrolase
VVADPQLAVLDLAGTTVTDDGLVEEAFTWAMARQGVVAGTPTHTTMLARVRSTMGESKITVFRYLCGDTARARQANADFEAAYAALVDEGRCAPIDGAAETIADLRADGVKVALTTGFSRPTLDKILDTVGWRGLADLALTPAEAGRGRPYPDLVLTAVLRLRIDDVRAVVTVGDTMYDMLTGRRAGAGAVVGVLTGAHDRAALAAAGATHVVDSVAELRSVLG